MHYKLSYRFARSGGNVLYKTKQRVKRVSEATEDADFLALGLSLAPDTTIGHAYIKLAESREPAELFAEAETVEQIKSVGARSVERQSSSGSLTAEGETVTKAHIRRFESAEDTADLLERVNRSAGGGFILHTDLTPCDPFSIDRWFGVRKEYTATVESPVTAEDISSFCREYRDAFDELQTPRVVVYRSPYSQTVRLAIACACTKSQLLASAQHGAQWSQVANLHRFDLSKAALVVHEDTHGPGHIEAQFMSDAGDVYTTRTLAYHDWFGEMAVHAHPLGRLVDGELYRPATERYGVMHLVGDPIELTTHRGQSSTPWQFGLTRCDDELLLTMARAGPETFDPVLKRFDIVAETVGDDPLIVSSTVTRRLWKEDPTNPAVTSTRSEGERVWLLYRNATGWHLSRPDPSDGFPDAGDDGSFAETDIPGVDVHSTGIRNNSSGDRTSTIEREYRLSADFVETHTAAYVLITHEREEESMETLEWDLSDATAYELQSDSSAPATGLATVETPRAVPRDQYIEAIQTTREYIHHNDGATKEEVIDAFEPEKRYPLGRNGVAAQVKGFVPMFRDEWWDDIVRGLSVLPDVTAVDETTERWKSTLIEEESITGDHR